MVERVKERLVAAATQLGPSVAARFDQFGGPLRQRLVGRGSEDSQSSRFQVARCDPLRLDRAEQVRRPGFS